jgi:hypothetical protein
LEDFETARAGLERYLKNVADHKRNRFRLTLAQKERVDSQWGSFIREKGYSWPDDHLTLE